MVSLSVLRPAAVATAVLLMGGCGQAPPHGGSPEFRPSPAAAEAERPHRTVELPTHKSTTRAPHPQRTTQAQRRHRTAERSDAGRVLQVAETRLTREELRSALLTRDSLRQSAFREPGGSTEPGEEATWRCLDAVGRIDEGPAATSEIVSYSTNAGATLTHQVISYRATAQAATGFARLRSAMAHCRRDRGVTVAGTEAVLEVDIVTEPGPKAEAAEEQLTITVSGVSISPDSAGGVMRNPVRSSLVVARAANHAVVLRWSWPYATDPGRLAARTMPSLTRIALNRLAAISQGCEPPPERIGQLLK
jgi:hypothetical protein